MKVEFDPKKPSILVIEDDPSMARAVHMQLSGDGYNVILSHDGADAVFRANNQKFDCIITDFHLPKFSADRIISHIRSGKINKATPIILISGQLTKEDLMRVLSHDANVKVLIKPFTIFAIKDLVAELVVDISEPEVVEEQQAA